jgi:hypothetical protein
VGKWALISVFSLLYYLDQVRFQRLEEESKTFTHKVLAFEKLFVGYASQVQAGT